MNDASDAGFRRRLADQARAETVHGLETLAPALGQHADEIDHGVRALHGGGDRSRVAHIGLDGDNLADAAERLQKEGEIGPAAGHAHAPAAVGELAHDMAPDEAGAAEYRHQPILDRNTVRHHGKPLRARTEFLSRPIQPVRRENHTNNRRDPEAALTGAEPPLKRRAGPRWRNW